MTTLFDVIHNANLHGHICAYHKCDADYKSALDANLKACDIAGIAMDSRKVQDGFLFLAMPGYKINGCDFIPQAIAAGAKAILVPDDAALDDGQVADLQSANILILQSPQIRQDAAHLAAAFYAQQPAHIAAITGTNGKTSIVNFMRQIWEQFGFKAASLGTIGLYINEDDFIAGSLTTPDPITLHEMISMAVDRGVTHLAIEASSHGLDQYRLDGLKIQAAGFTNLTHDHLDYHHDMAHYRAAKGRLFTDLAAKPSLIGLNIDSAEYDYYAKAARDAGHYILSYGHDKAADLRIISRQANPKGQDVVLSIMGDEYAFFLPLVGEFQLMNMLCAMIMSVPGLMGDKSWCDNAKLLRDEVKTIMAQIVAIMPKIQSVRGRMELVDVPGLSLQDKAIYVDYAHTPDALETVIKALRPHTKGRLITIVGCGGDRDKTKRPIMAKIAHDYSDIAIITDDNPRTEDATQIRADMLAGIPNANHDDRVKEVFPREAAIDVAVNMMAAGDVLLVAGKGHEQGQIIGTQILPFDDVSQVQKSLTHLYKQSN